MPKSKIKDARADEIRLTLPLPYELQDALIEAQRQVAQNGKKKTSRVTVNSFMRAYIEAMAEVHVDLGNVTDEASLKAAVRKALFRG